MLKTTLKALRVAVVFPIWLVLMVPLVALQAACVIAAFAAMPFVWAGMAANAAARRVAGDEAGPALAALFLLLAAMPLLAALAALLAP